MSSAGRGSYTPSMRLGLLGPALDHEDELEESARRLRDELGATRVVYLGADRALESVVSRWAVGLVGADAGDDTLLSRATATCLGADFKEIDGFLERERSRDALRMFESLAGEMTRSVELIAGKVAVMLYDKAYLEEDDILPATLLIFGKHGAPLIKQVGRRWFLSPGTFPEHGVMVVDDDDGDLSATVYDRAFVPGPKQVLEAPKALKMRTQGGV